MLGIRRWKICGWREIAVHAYCKCAIRAIARYTIYVLVFFPLRRCQEGSSRNKHGVTKHMKNVVFWDVARCRSCVNRCFGGTYRLHLPGRKIRERGTSVSRWLQTEHRSETTSYIRTRREGM
jgi:hypothetical protein